jgi:hypothetical protein
MQAETMHAGPMVGIAGAMEMEGKVPSNNTFERTVGHHGPRLAAARSSWSAAQLGRYMEKSEHRLKREGA